MKIRAQHPSANHPPAGAKPARTALQKHADYFDGNSDGRITVGEAYRGMRDVGLGRLAAGLGAFAGNAFLGPATGAPWYNPLTINADNIAKGKHAGDSGTFDNEGNFSPAKLNDMYVKHDADRDNALSRSEIDSMIAANKGGSFLGAFLSKVEFGLLMKVAGEQRELPAGEGPVLTRERMQAFYDGTLLYALAGRAVPS